MPGTLAYKFYDLAECEAKVRNADPSFGRDPESLEATRELLGLQEQNGAYRITPWKAAVTCGLLDIASCVFLLISTAAYVENSKHTAWYFAAAYTGTRVLGVRNAQRIKRQYEELIEARQRVAALYGAE